MPVHASHVSDKRQFAGEEDAAKLVKWLNAASGTPERERVVKIVETARRIAHLRAQKPALVLAHESFFGEKTELNKAYNRYQRMLRRYRFFPLIQPWSPIAPHMWTAVEHGRDKLSDDSPHLPYDDFDAVHDLARLADRGLFDKLLRCSCERWLFARFSHQRFCSARCREREFKASPEWRAHRRKKAREYYWLHRNQNVK
jgi:hypothetical protein